jgi:hypothetical protein
MNKQLLYIFSLLFISTLLVQCKAKKPLIEQNSVIIHLSKNQADTIVRKILRNNFEFENLKAKINTRFKSREKQNLIFGTFIKMHKDSAIHATISVLGIPIVVALITPDSLKFVNKKDQKYFEGDFYYVSQLLKTEITFGQIQDLLIGNPIRMDSNSNHYLIQENEDFYISSLSRNELNEMKSNGNWQVKFWINELFKAGKTLISNDSTGTRIKIFQADYKKIDGKLFPNRTKAEIITAKDSISIHLNYQRVKINTDLEYEYSVPSHYKKYE